MQEEREGQGGRGGGGVGGGGGVDGQTLKTRFFSVYEVVWICVTNWDFALG